MELHRAKWQQWRQFFERRKDRPLPALKQGGRIDLPPSVAKSLAIFQLGESGGGTIVAETRRSRLPGVDEDYAEAMALFVKEENRHAHILALCVRQLGGELIRKNWTARMFVFSRRLMGLRLKVMVLLAAEVVGICYYHLLSSRMPECQIRNWLSELVIDEEAHLHFHCRFLRSQTLTRWRQSLFVLVWRTTMLAAALAVMIDHRAAIRDMDLDIATVWRRWMTYSKHAERLVVDSGDAIHTVQFNLPLN